MVPQQVSFVERLSLSQRVPYQRFHCINIAGQKAGYLGSAFFFGNFIGSFGWGWASDIFGRKPIMLLGLFFTLIMELLFGFSQNFAWAVSARFLWGLLNGNLGVVKTYISEVCTILCYIVYTHFTVNIDISYWYWYVQGSYTVEPLNSGHIGDKDFVHCPEVVPFSEVEMYGQYNRQGAKSVSIVGRLSTLWSVHYLRFHCNYLHTSLFRGLM